jgi:Rieske Fe-S protein
MLPVLQSCEPTSVPTATPIDPGSTDNGFVSVDVSDVTPANPAKKAPGGLLGPDGKPIVITLTSDGVYHALSMACTHETGILNPTLTSGMMSCPLHFSRFDLNGVPTPESLAKRPLTAYETQYIAATHTLKIKIA